MSQFEASASTNDGDDEQNNDKNEKRADKKIKSFSFLHTHHYLLILLCKLMRSGFALLGLQVRIHHHSLGLTQHASPPLLLLRVALANR